MKAKIFLTRRLSENIMDKINCEFDLINIPGDTSLTKTEIIEGVKKTDFLFCLLSDNIDADVIGANLNLKGILNYAVGYNNIDIEFASKMKIPVCNTPDVLTEATADLAWALVFATARRIVESHNFMLEKKFTGWEPTLLMGYDIFGKTIGIIGAGRIGSAVAKRAKGFDMEILYYNRSRNYELEKSLNATKVDLDTILQKSDFLSLNCPLTAETKHLITLSELKKMKKNAILINTARGAVIKEEDLIFALKNGIIAGAGLDVYEFEPKVSDELFEMNNVVLLPHIGSATYETRDKMGYLCIENAKLIMDGHRPKTIVNSEIYS